MNGIMDIESKMNGIMDIENIIINTDLINDITKDLFDLANKRNVLKASIHSIQMKEDSVQFVPYTHQKKIFVVYAIYNKYSWSNSPRKNGLSSGTRSELGGMRFASKITFSPMFADNKEEFHQPEGYFVSARYRGIIKVGGMA